MRAHEVYDLLAIGYNAKPKSVLPYLSSRVFIQNISGVEDNNYYYQPTSSISKNVTGNINDSFFLGEISLNWRFSGFAPIIEFSNLGLFFGVSAINLETDSYTYDQNGIYLHGTTSYVPYPFTPVAGAGLHYTGSNYAINYVLFSAIRFLVRGNSVGASAQWTTSVNFNGFLINFK